MRKLLGLSPDAMRATAWVLLSALSVTTLGPMLHGAHDADFTPVVVFHADHDHVLTTAPGEHLAGEHCVACHFVRSSRGPVSWEPAGLHPFAAGLLVAWTDWHVTVPGTSTPVPARAPPAA